MTKLSLEGLTAGYHGGTVLHGISLEVAPGEVYSVVGHNGAGKTTLFHTVAGLIPVGDGRIVLDGKEIQSEPTHRRARAGIGYVPQGRRVFGSVTVAEHLAIARRRRHTRWTQARLMEMFPQLAARRSHRGGQLSGGEQQMLAIARALLGDPQLLLLDEPTEGLAPVIVAQIRDTIAELAAEGMTILLAAPQPQWPVAIADQVAVLSAGRLSERFSGEELREDSRRLDEALSINASSALDEVDS